MPYTTNDELPKAVRSKLSAHQQSVFRNVFNSMMGEDSMTESRAFAGAWSQAKQASVKKDISFEGQILKQDSEERLVYGWAYVSTDKGEISLDHSGEFVRPDQIAKAATNFMLTMRTAKSMHTGGKIGEVVHSMPLTHEISKALGIQSDREGWLVAIKVYDDQVWQDVKSGKLAAFSIGGRALKEMV
jgi:cation transport regulator ChaB